MKQFHRILEKELVFFLKKTTNFCTATIFDIHLVKKIKIKKSTEKPSSSYDNCQHSSGQRKQGAQAENRQILALFPNSEGIYKLKQ